jgi:cytochrome bd-type quinol oxidase subunit 2
LAIVAPAYRRSVRALVVSGLFFAGLVIQLAVMAGGARPERNRGFRLGALPDVFSLRVTVGLLIGDRFLGEAWASYGRAFAYGALLAVALLVTVLLVRSDRRTIAFALIALAYASLFFCVQLVGRVPGASIRRYTAHGWMRPATFSFRFSC